MGDLQIIVKNTSDEVQNFLIFNDVPAFSKNAGKAWTNVWGRSPGVGSSNGITDLTVQTSDYQNVNLGSGKDKATKVLMMIEDGGAVFDKPGATKIDKNGSFAIQTSGYDMSKYEHAFCGLGMKSPIPDEEDVVPVAVWQAKPNQQYQITPKRIFYIATGDYKAGKIVNVADLGATATIDFTGRKETIATVVFNKELSYEPVKYKYDES